MTDDTEGAASDLADALAAFARAAGPDGGADLWLTIATPYDIEQRTVHLPAGVADWITELLREETQALESGGRAAGDVDDDQAVDVEPAWW
ncbi:hypothetical protein ABTZ03_42605 [Kitasatospora sp. NPDC096077]|uniref:hypothetical protein n=1 Tax=Kitasatospora sp. NPDC096077 TaxID=3155544 RepID=UPI0033169EBF